MHVYKWALYVFVCQEGIGRPEVEEMIEVVRSAVLAVARTIAPYW